MTIKTLGMWTVQIWTFTYNLTNFTSTFYCKHPRFVITMNTHFEEQQKNLPNSTLIPNNWEMQKKQNSSAQVEREYNNLSNGWNKWS